MHTLTIEQGLEEVPYTEHRPAVNQTAPLGRMVESMREILAGLVSLHNKNLGKPDFAPQVAVQIAEIAKRVIEGHKVSTINPELLRTPELSEIAGVADALRSHGFPVEIDEAMGRVVISIRPVGSPSLPKMGVPEGEAPSTLEASQVTSNPGGLNLLGAAETEESKPANGPISLGEKIETGLVPDTEEKAKPTEPQGEPGESEQKPTDPVELAFQKAKAEGLVSSAGGDGEQQPQSERPEGNLNLGGASEEQSEAKA